MEFYVVGFKYNDGRRGYRYVVASDEIHACKMFLIRELRYKESDVPVFDSVAGYKQFMRHILGHVITSPVKVTPRATNKYVLHGSKESLSIRVVNTERRKVIMAKKKGCSSATKKKTPKKK